MEQKLNGVTQKVAQYAKKYGEIVGVGGTDASSWMAKLALKWLLMKTFWLIIFAIFSVWTVQSGAALVERYVAADTISVLTVVNNQPFAVPKGTVCLPIYGFTLDELFQKENGSTTSVKEYFSMKSMTKEKFLENGGDLLWPRTVMDYLTTMSLVEAGEWWQAVLAFSTNYSIMTLNEDDGWEPGYKELSWIGYFNYFMMRDYLNEDSWNAQFLLEDFLNQLGVSVEELKQALGRKIIKLFSLTAAHYTDGSEEMYYRPIANFRIAFVSWYYTCFDVDFPSENVMLTSKMEFVYVQMDPHPTLSTRINGQDKTVNMLYDVIGRYATSMQQNIAKMDNADFNTITELGWNKTFVISVQASYKAMPVVKGKKQCSEDSTRNLRQRQCYVETFQNQCNCTPVMSPLMLPARQRKTRGDCSFAKLDGCLKLGDLETGESKICRKKLLPDCDYRKYEIQSPTGVRSPGHGQLARITIKVKGFTSPYFEEQYEWTNEDFIGALGGVLGLWLGLDFLIVVQFIVSALSILLNIGMALLKPNGRTGRMAQATSNEAMGGTIERRKTIIVVPKD